ncbi:MULTISPECIES: NAD-dependent succinate-semialdehyde dehydrogenase [Bradyrhizobium]|uniref:NAD-dependent succinate-semialdehyde dehydrogenase n=3 Tax=Bradyrhizobium TaxID=374 RepID=A0AAE5X9C5_9BRAD|nr:MULTISPECIES: NAD-dependent succinate-semialdehyde dehydrogenase [Bradyrhizobium]MCG2629393.1 NAD-dependent succinate-semialdehyde dehydrogenase [Bradyrhizobium zhengyangense]MCG2644674.1 NAD-dependent succinate-semialdehyde dehydrogenase [Bradyrhizobium zhengyangense]MCG2670907.1 NAD-dependent succinate-semialdehyde dehydrogenase [Bradyrhizobium zhengyangense]MDN4984540.1 NAD-dependent succinate-semialdehyde dehydrogenase [Bradyrhizobium sp. WYCCWR 13022]MDN5002532.1 NAD-dependent succinat
MTGHTPIRLFIGGKWIERNGAPILNPANEAVLGIVPMAREADLAAAVDAATNGFNVWSLTSAARRSEIIRQAAANLRANADVVARDITLEQGKPLRDAQTEVRRACQVLEWDAEEGRRLYGRTIPSEPGYRNTVQLYPIGPVAAFSPWNYPLSSVARKVGGALSAGCSLVLKASEETPAAAVHLAEAFVKAGLPDGVLNLVFGIPADISRYLIGHPSIRLVAFTGSVPVGKGLAAQAGMHMKPCIMELGGHAPVIICDDVDPLDSASRSVAAKASNSGQICTSPTRWFVHDSIYGEFVNNMGEAARKIEVGNGLDPATQMGPVANSRRLAAIQELVSEAIAKGARLVAGGERIKNNGYYWPLTVLADVPADARIMKEEPFGPVALVNSVTSLPDAIKRANELPYGLAGYAMTHSADYAGYIADHMQVGNLAINHFTSSLPETPFGGTKDSGYAREGGAEGLLNYTIVRSISFLAGPPRNSVPAHR